MARMRNIEILPHVCKPRLAMNDALRALIQTKYKEVAEHDFKNANDAYFVKNEKCYFIVPYGDIEPTIRTGAKDPTRWTVWRSSNFEFLKKELERENGPATVLDFGVGQGQFERLLERFPNKVAADFFPYQDADVICDLTKPLPFSDSTFDVIIASNVFEHLPNTREVLEECSRVLKPGGRIIGMIPFLLGVHQEPYDFHRYTPFMLQDILTKTNFKEIQITALTSPLDVYRHTQKHFFYRLFAFAKSRNFFLHIVAKLVWWNEKILNKILLVFFRGIPIDAKYTLGYGFVAKK